MLYLERCYCYVLAYVKNIIETVIPICFFYFSSEQKNDYIIFKVFFQTLFK